MSFADFLSLGVFPESQEGQFLQEEDDLSANYRAALQSLL